MIAAAVLILAPATALQAQERGTPPAGPQAAPQLPDSIQEMVDEYQATREALGKLQDSAMAAHPELQTQQAEVQETIRVKMVEMNPEIETRMERMESLRGEMEAAQQAQDQQKMQGLVMEARQIQQAVQSAQMQAMETDVVSDAIDEFEEDLLDAMTEIDPEAEATMDRLNELTEELQAFQESRMNGGPGGGGGR